MSRNICLIDVDGVMYNIMEAIQLMDNRFNPEMVTDYALRNEQYGISRDKVMKLLNDVKTYEKQSRYSSVSEGIKNIRKKGYIPVAWTGLWCKDAVGIRIKQIKSLGLVGYIYCGDKKVADMDRIAAVIDDNPAELSKFDSSVQRMIVSRSYNMDYIDETVIRVSNLVEASKKLKVLNSIKV